MKLPKTPQLRLEFVKKNLYPLWTHEVPLVAVLNHLPHIEWEAQGRPFVLSVSTIVMVDSLLAAYDVAYGNTIVYDSRRRKLTHGKAPIFADSFVILDSFFGFEGQPAIYKRLA